jgi:hypothetical protein
LRGPRRNQCAAAPFLLSQNELIVSRPWPFDDPIVLPKRQNSSRCWMPDITSPTLSKAEKGAPEWDAAEALLLVAGTGDPQMFARIGGVRTQVGWFRASFARLPGSTMRKRHQVSLEFQMSLGLQVT